MSAPGALRKILQGEKVGTIIHREGPPR
jgi:hypothetical protein